MVGQPEFGPNRAPLDRSFWRCNLTALVHDHDHSAHLVKGRERLQSDENVFVQAGDAGVFAFDEIRVVIVSAS